MKNKLLKNFLLTGRSSIRGKLIGRKKMRDSDLIRKLLKAGMTFRQISLIAKCSHGSVWAEKVAMNKDESIANTISGVQVPETVFPEVQAP